MSLDHIILSDTVLEKLYRDALVTGNPATEAKPAKAKAVKAIGKETTNTESRIKFLGNNKKNILLVVSEKDHAFLSDDDLNFLLNILNACNITLEDAALVNSFSDETLDHESLEKQFSPAVIICLGPELHSLGFPLQIPQYRVQAYNGQQYLSAGSLKEISSDKELKKSLWLALKTIFSI